MSSGYLLFNSECRTNKIVRLWFQVEFYSVVLFLILGFNCNVEIKSYISACFPLLRNQYWYFTCYIIVFILAQFINKFLSTLNDDDWKRLVYTLFIIFPIGTTLAAKDIFFLNRGYSPMWLIILYVFGAYFRHKETSQDYSIKKKIIALILIVSFTVLIELVSNFLFGNKLGGFSEVRDIIVGYVTILTFLSIVILFQIFIRIKLKGNLVKTQTIIQTISNATFGIYCFHDNVYVRKLYSTLLENRYGWIEYVIAVLTLFWIGFFVEQIRKKIMKYINLSKDKWIHSLD